MLPTALKFAKMIMANLTHNLRPKESKHTKRCTQNLKLLDGTQPLKEVVMNPPKTTTCFKLTLSALSVKTHSCFCLTFPQNKQAIKRSYLCFVMKPRSKILSFRSISALLLRMLSKLQYKTFIKRLIKMPRSHQQLSKCLDP